MDRSEFHSSDGALRAIPMWVSITFNERDRLGKMCRTLPVRLADTRLTEAVRAVYSDPPCVPQHGPG